MSHKYDYDTKGNVTSFLLLTILIPIIILLIVRRSPKTCTCTHHKKINKKNYSIFYTLPLIAFTGYLAYIAINAKFEAPQSPYTILGIEDNASKMEVKKAYRKLIIKHDPDRNKNQAECTEKLFEINLAYKQITQGLKIKNTILNEIVAIPEFIVERKYTLMCLYFVFLAVFVYIGLKLWRESVRRNVYGVEYKTVDVFYKKIDDMMARDSDCIVRNIINLMGESTEYQNASRRANNWVKNVINKDNRNKESKEVANLQPETTQKNVNQQNKRSSESSNKDTKKNVMPIQKNLVKDAVFKLVKNNIESKFAYPIKESSPGFYVLMDHLFRTNVFKNGDRNNIAQKSLGMVAVMKRIAIAKNLHDILNSLFMLQRMITQAVFEPAYYALQFPSMEFEDVFLKRKNIDESGINLPRLKILKFFSFIASNDTDADECSSSEEIDEVNKNETSNNYRNTILTIKAIVSKDSMTETPVDDAFFIRGRGEIDYDLINATGKLKKTIVHAPFIDKELLLVWEAIFTFQGEIIRTFSFSDFYGSKELIFEMASEKGKLELEIKNGQYFGCDVKSEIILENQ